MRCACIYNAVLFFISPVKAIHVPNLANSSVTECQLPVSHTALYCFISNHNGNRKISVEVSFCSVLNIFWAVNINYAYSPVG